MKIPLLLNAGVAYAATTPLFYTLQWDNKYCHTGLAKSTHWLYVIQENLTSYRKFTDHPLLKKQTWEDKLWKPMGLSDTKFTKKENTYFYSLPTSIEKYIEYYKRHWEYLNDEYNYVGDFSNKICLLDENFLMSIRDKLLEVFDIKVTICFRDPVRRIWSISRCSMDLVNKNFDSKAWHYDKIYTTQCNVWGKDNVYPIVTEDCWEDPSGLSDFLGVKIDKMHRNCYYPEKGSDVPHYDFLKDQWQYETSPIEYDFMRKKCDHLYVNFKNTFGYIPEKWNKKDFDK